MGLAFYQSCSVVSLLDRSVQQKHSRRRNKRSPMVNILSYISAAKKKKNETEKRRGVDSGAFSDLLTFLAVVRQEMVGRTT